VFIKGLVDEVVELITAVEVTTSLAGAWWNANVSHRVPSVGNISATIA
jgi:hypothetical protein